MGEGHAPPESALDLLLRKSPRPAFAKCSKPHGLLRPLVVALGVEAFGLTIVTGVEVC